MKILFDDGSTATFPDDSAVINDRPFHHWICIKVEGSTDIWINGQFVKAFLPDKLELEY
jgi:hypothetical protein